MFVPIKAFILHDMVNDQYLICHLQGNDSVLELFTVLSEEEVQRKMSKKLKKAKKKAAK